eukprot:554857_1
MTTLPTPRRLNLSMKKMSLMDIHQENKKRCYKNQHLHTSWRSTDKNTESNQRISNIRHDWTIAHNQANASIMDYKETADSFIASLKPDETKNKDVNNKNDMDYSLFDDQSQYQEVLFKHDAVKIYICKQNQQSYTLLGKGELIIKCSKDDSQNTQTKILFIKNKNFLLAQTINNLLEKCVYNPKRNSIDWCGNNNQYSIRIKFRAVFDDVHNNNEAASRFLELYNQCWNEWKQNHFQIMFKKTKPILKASIYVVMKDYVNAINFVSDTPKLHMTFRYEVFLISLHDKCRYNLYESHIIPRCVPSNVIVHQVNNEKSLMKLYMRPQTKRMFNINQPIFDDFILYKQTGMLTDTLCITHTLPTFCKWSKRGVKIFNHLFENFVNAEHAKRFEKNIGCFVHLTCYSKRIHLCTHCCLKYIHVSNGLSKLFGYIEEFIIQFKQNN